MVEKEKLSKIIDFCKEKEIEYLADEPMKNHTTFKIGGPCDLLITISNCDELKKAILLCKEEDIPYMILGKGSNLLVHDKGIDGVIISLDGEFKEMNVDFKEIYCGAAVKLADLCKFALENSLTGLEFAFGIPGSVGGAAFMNAGAYGGEFKDVVKSVTYMDEDGDIKEYKKEELEFGYRTSVFKNTNDIILFVTFELSMGEEKEIKNQMDSTLQKRIDKQPLDFPSAGSVFKRPVGNYAGTLIQQCGLKGKTIGGAQISEKHSGFIINIGDATCENVLELCLLVQNTVKEQTGYFLEREIIDIGR